MDFYAHQDEARKKTRVLVGLFTLAVAILLALTNAMVAATYYYVLRGGKVVTHHYSAPDLTIGLGWQTYLTVSLCVIAVILAAITFKWRTLSSGGKAVAESMGGRLIQPNAADGAERRILNVVEEMAIASGMPVPPVYLLEHEAGINAFAAGTTPANAVIGVTQGAIQRLNREQLQGVVGHEFSHIFNGDMRLNLHLVAVLHGILFIGAAGRALLSDDDTTYRRNSWRRRGTAQLQLALLGVGLVVVGWLGSFFGSWIKAAVSRQREFLADASAVQFTRNADGFADALRVIGGCSVERYLRTSGAEQYSHMFFDDALLRSSRLFATHPLLEERIRRIKPGWDGSYIFETAVFAAAYQKPASAAPDNIVLPDIEYTPHPVGAKVIEVATTTASIGAADWADFLSIESSTPELPIAVAQTLLQTIPPQLREQCHEPLGAVAIVCGLLLVANSSVRERQLAHITLCEMPGLTILTQQLAADIERLAPQLRLSLLQLCLPALKLMSLDQYKRVRRALLLMIRADGKLDLAEWCVFQVVCHCVDPALGVAKASRPQYRKVVEVAAELQQVLSMLAWFGHPDASPPEVEKAFRCGADAVNLPQLSLFDASACRIDEFGRAVSKLGNCYPLLKPQLLKALAACAQHDNVIRPLEHEVIHAIAVMLDCPMPVMLTL